MNVNLTVDAKGLACPMPIVRTKKAIDQIESGEVLEVLATDKGSKADIKAWADKIGHQYLGTLEEGDVLKHYIRKARSEEEKEEQNYPHVVTNEELAAKLEAGITVLDVREPAEYAFGHIPGAVSVPLGDLEGGIAELDKEKETYVICRTGSRSDMAAQKLTELGFTNVKNVVPGMSKWEGPTA
ncbi:sulfurtransferase TusA family protein [Sutcliffiella horikoshii]|uniref:sulfurtransferase TusA family protein n=1 Tax=Sutcliffiella horikoshii TaxID=79883 RepID=UPI00385065C0